MRKSLFPKLAIICLIVLSIVSCRSKKGTIVGEIKIPDNTDVMALEAWSYKVPITIKSDTKWKIETTGDFFYVYPEEGSGNETINLCISYNTDENRHNGELHVIFPKDESKNIILKLQQKSKSDYDDNAVSLDEGNQKYAVGFGYNSMSGYADVKSVKKEILRFEKLASAGLITYGPVDSEASLNTYTGSTVKEISNDLAVKASISGGYGKFKGEANASFNHNYFSSNNYEYALTYYDLGVRFVDLSLNLDEIRLKENMQPAAYAAINGLEFEGKPSVYKSDSEGFKKLIQDYGTHLCTCSKMGGRIRYSMATDISKITSEYDINAFAKASYEGIFVKKTEGSVDEKYKSSFKSNSTNCDIKMSVVGGTSETVRNLISQGGFTKDNVDKWLAGLKEDNMALVDFKNGDGNTSLIPLYDLIDQSTSQGRYRAELLRKYMNGDDITTAFFDQSNYECGTVVKINLSDAKFTDTNSLIKDIKINGHLIAQLCEEYVPLLSKDSRIKVLYPVFNNKTCFNMGFFPGNASHKPARVSWNGSSVIIKEYDRAVGERKIVYLRGSSISDDTDVNYSNGIISEAYMEGYSNEGFGYNYPLVKIFNKIWTREDYQGRIYNDGSRIGAGDMAYDNGQSHLFYKQPAAKNVKLAPKGWSVASDNDYATIQSILVNNGISNIGGQFFDSGHLGFNAFTGWLSWVGGYSFINNKSQAEYLSSSGKHVRMQRAGGYAIEPIDNSYGMCVRMVKN